MIGMTEWKPVVGFEGLYEVSDNGLIKSLARTRGNGILYKEKLLKQQCQWTGYMQVQLYRSDGSFGYYKVHRIVAEAFIPNPDNKPQVNHKNGIKNDNHVENLEWVTSNENHRHAFDELGKKSSKTQKGRPSARRKLTDAQINEILSDDRSQSRIAVDYGVSQQTISNIKRGLMYRVAEDDFVGENDRVLDDFSPCRACGVKPVLNGRDGQNQYVRCPKCGIRSCYSRCGIEKLRISWNAVMD